MEKISGIYCIENKIDGKKYIGQSVDIESRWYRHKYELNAKQHFNSYLQNAWNKYGEDNFNFYIIELCKVELLDEREEYYIDFYKTLDRNVGYNMTAGGHSNKYINDEISAKISKALMGHVVSSESRLKISLHHADVSGKNNGMYGRHHTDETKAIISQKNKGRISAKRNHTKVYCVQLSITYLDAADAAKQLGLDSSAILKCCRGERKTCGGYNWEFINLENINC